MISLFKKSIFISFFVAASLWANEEYLWLEQTNSPATQEWLGRQAAIAEGYLQDVEGRDDIEARITEIASYESRSIPKLYDGYKLFIRRLPEHRYPVLAAEYEGECFTLYDPNLQEACITKFELSPSEEFLAIGLSYCGSDWETWKVIKLSTGEVLQDQLEDIKFGGPIWSNDSQGFFYGRFKVPPEKYLGSTTEVSYYYHKLGTDQSCDILVTSFEKRPEFDSQPFETNSVEDLHFFKIDQKMMKVAMHDGRGEIEELFDCGEDLYRQVGRERETLYFLTNRDAATKKLVAFNLATASETDILPNIPGMVLLEVKMAKDKILAVYLKDLQTELKVYTLKGDHLYDIPLPKNGTVSAKWKDLHLEVSYDGQRVYFGFTNFVTPISIYSFDLSERKLETYFKPETSWDQNEFVIEQVYYQSKDGTAIPLFLAYKKGMVMNGEVPTLLYGYGGFNTCMTPFFSSAYLHWMEKGGILAVANIRGGGEYGAKWHSAAVGKKKQTSFDDCIAAAEWLIESGYTNSKKLAVTGRSNGGLLAAVCIVQRPELFKSAIVGVGVLDMLRFHLFTVGKFWIPEYGSPEKSKDRKTLLAYSPLHNIQNGIPYPAVLVSTGDHDDRVVPHHSYKFAAAIQEATASSEPVILRVYPNAGHGIGPKPVEQRIQEYTDELIFLFKTLE